MDSRCAFFAVSIGLTLLFSAYLAHAEPLPGPDLCLRSAPADDQASAPAFRVSGGSDWDFRNSSAGCGSVLDGILGKGPWARAAGTAIEASRLMLGLDLDVRKLVDLARNFGLASKSPQAASVVPEEGAGQDEFSVKSHSSIILRASRKRFFLGLGIKW